MRISLLFLTFTIGLLAQYNSAVAQNSRTVKFENRYEKKMKGVTCTVVSGGQAVVITTPSWVKLPLDGNGELDVTSVTCDFQGLKRTTTYFPNANKFGAEIYGLTVDFKSSKAEFSFKKKNGGVALYTRGSEVITVR